MDGVLIDARDWHYEALNSALQPFGLLISRDEHLSTFDGLSTRQKLDILSRARGLPKGLHSFINGLKQKHTQALIVARCHPVFHHRYMLARLKRENFHLAMCSNSIRQTVDTMARQAGIIDFFDITLSNEDVANSKPAPDIYLEAMRRLNVRPDECLVVEDNANGIAAARAAGAHVLEVADPDDVTYDRVFTALSSLCEGTLS
jgi:beta-phosphoglucomutase-like phosphatase (HAD superfamily)